MSKFSAFLLIFCCCFSKNSTFHTSKQFPEDLLHEQAAIPDTNNVAKRSASDVKESAVPHKNDLHDNQHGGHLDNSHSNHLDDTHSNRTALATNETEHHEDEHEDGQSHGGVKHHGIHLASWNFDHVQGPFIIAVFLLTAGIAKLGFHHANILSSKVPESCLLIILGAVVGTILHYATGDKSAKPALTSDLFFLYLLPPIVLESAYSLHDRTFYENIGTTLIYAVIGTVLNCFLIGPVMFGLYKVGALGEGMPVISLIQCLVFSAVIVAVDPVAVLAIFQEVGVNNTLYFLVFGESLLNDAVTVVLYNTMKTFNLMEAISADQLYQDNEKDECEGCVQIVLGFVQFFVVSLGGLSIGIICGALTAIMTKYTEHCRVVEPLAVFAMAYISYLAAEMFHFSGIISIIGCGLVQAQYAFHNISRKSYTTVKYFSKMQSATSDCIIFLFLGISLFKDEVLNPNNWHAGFILWSLLLCLVIRFLVVFGLTMIINKSSRVRRIDLEEQFIMAYGGLRGAVAFSLVDLLDKNNLPKGHFLTTTLVIIFFTVFVQGITIKPLVKLLRVKMQEDEKLLMSEEINSHVTDHMMAGIEEILGEKGEHHWRELIEYYNSRFFKYWLQRDPITSDEQIMKIFEQLALETHFENLMGTKMVQEKYGSEEELKLHEHINASFEAGNEEEESDDSQEGEETPLQIPSLVVSSEDINADLDVEMIREQASRRRKSLFPINLSKKAETKLIENPTAVDIRKIMVPSRRQLQYRKLDKNLKSDDSENDLLRYLQDKQQRTRRMSQAIFALPQLPTLGEGVEYNPSSPSGRRKSLNPVAMADIYKRRLSLAVPQSTYGRRGVSMGNVLKGMDSPARRRLRLKRSATSESSDGSIRENNPPSPSWRNPRRVAFTGSPSTPSMGSEALGIIAEDGDEGNNGSNGDTVSDIKPQSKFKKSEKSSSSLKLRKTAFSDVINEVSPGSSKDSHISSSSSTTSCPSPSEKSDVNDSRLKRSSSTGSSRTRSSDRGIRFVPVKDSPSLGQRKRLQRSSMESDPEEKRWSSVSDPRENSGHDIELQDDKTERVGSLRKNVSYTKALSNEGFE